MSKPITILPNFEVLFETNHPDYLDKLIGIMRCFCEVVSYAEHIDTYKITSSSFWKGMNNTNIDFIALLKEYSESIPENVLSDLEAWNNKTAILIGDDCILIKNSDLLQECSNSAAFSRLIDKIENNVIFLKGYDYLELRKLFEEEFNCALFTHKSKMKTYIMDIGSMLGPMIVKAANEQDALIKLYGRENFTEERLKRSLSVKKEVTSEHILNFMLQLKDKCEIEIREAVHNVIEEPYFANLK